MSNKPRHIVAIVQARMGSSRLPGKVMKPLLDKPLIGHLFTRLKQSQMIDQIVLATSDDENNDELVSYITSLGFDVIRGSEDNVLNRFVKAAKQTAATDIVRITGDSPLLCADICDRLINSYFDNNADYAYLSERFAEGVDCEVISAEALLKTEANAQKASELEHVTLYVYSHPKNFKIVELDNQIDDSKYRFTVDNAEDFEVVEAIASHFQYNFEHCLYLDIKKFLDENPSVMALNSHITRNEGLQISLAADSTNNAN
ncbi:NTP transferase domain-containing protein [Thalassotalea sp. M1531]|uniref:NTP transferase domain-containing protein n=1 Tax=Thalassotalea algicola TaxID=2716224 RepID=A0A7Y0Q863_9GAMM|nr:glycosyltransferase family protein [Thalassotalea algicola]NMP32901.1 NTP transferase domain-containing protein [Thalassotalea algicola]